MNIAKEEKKAKELRRLASLLHIPVPEAFWTLEVFDKDGKLLQRHHQRSHSWTRNAYNWMFAQLASKCGTDAVFGAGNLNLKDTGGTIRNGAYPVSHRGDQDGDTPAANYDILTPAANIDKGILVGSGLNAESFEDFVLQTPIAEGVGAGQLNAVASNNHDISYGALVLKDEQVRYFNNNSGGDVSINEVALVDGMCVGSSVSHYDVAMARDHLGVTVTVPDTGQVKVTYTVQLTFPA